jgi:hypothetical protein
MRRSDGSFDLHIVFEGLQADSTGLERWLATWFEKNATWKRVWIGGGKEETEVLSFLEEFIAPPSLENSGKGEISVLLRVRPQARWWKDWMVKLTQAVCDAFPGITHSRFEST